MNEKYQNKLIILLLLNYTGHFNLKMNYFLLWIYVREEKCFFIQAKYKNLMKIKQDFILVSYYKDLNIFMSKMWFIEILNLKIY